jgi:2-polyprenyl-3-methyl-5-hydroxy-6-metoxy-1,4-benzoquinol methylase
VDADYWNSMAESYGENLLEIARESGAGVLEEEIGALADRRGRVADMGCGPGSLLPFLAGRFGEVIGIDYADSLLEVARKRCGAQNVSFRSRDLSNGQPLRLEADVICCVNALIDPIRVKREGMATTLASAARPGGSMVMVVPAFESVLHVYHSLLRCRAREGAGSGLLEGEADELLREEVTSFAGGVVRVGGVLTKYWVREELLAFLADHGWDPRRVRRVEYSWSEEIEDPPAWLGSPGPWDWLVVADRAMSAEP